MTTTTNVFPIPQITAAAQVEATAVQALCEAVRTACADPADAVQLLSVLATYAPVGAFGADSIAADLATAQTATAAMCRRAALASLAIATSTYQPTSYQDAIALRASVCGLLDDEILIAGDAGDYDSYGALRTLRSAVSADLTTRAGNLASVVQFTLPTSLPSLVVAYRLYQDATRSDDLVGRVNPVNPLFMPRSFQALAS